MVYKLAEDLFIKKFKKKFRNDEVCSNFIGIYLDYVDEEHEHCINGVLWTPYYYGRRYLLEEGDTDFDEPFWWDGIFYEGAFWP